MEIGQLRLHLLQFFLQGLNLVVADRLPILNGTHNLPLPFFCDFLQFLPGGFQLLPEDHHIILHTSIGTSICVLRLVTSSIAFCKRSACLWYCWTSPACLAAQSVMQSMSFTGLGWKYPPGGPLSTGLQIYHVARHKWRWRFGTNEDSTRSFPPSIVHPVSWYG